MIQITKNWYEILKPEFEKQYFKDLQAWLNVGWYANNYVSVYSPDNEQKIVSISDVNSYKNAGWYENVAEINRAAFIESARQQLRIPDNLSYECIVGDVCYYWEAAGIWIVSVGFYSPYSGEYFAGASFDIKTGEKARNILDFMESLYY